MPGLFKGMCAALQHAHNENIVHSDFKPGNVFVTSKGITKVFDFGIARAVAQAQFQEAPVDDRTIFDAGTLGALTPAYASLEMLQGHVPDVRDDVFALACVIYEMFAGVHPFNKTPADEAERLRLKPERIAVMTKRQWRVLEKALAFRRENRVESVDALYEGLTAVYAPAYKAIAVGLLVLLSLATLYIFFKPEPKSVSADDIRSEVEIQIRLDYAREKLADLLKRPEFSSAWEAQLLDAMKILHDLLPQEDDWLQQQAAMIYDLYLKKITETREARKFDRSAELIRNASAYTQDNTRLMQEAALLEQAVAAEKERRRQLAAQQSTRDEAAVEQAVEAKQKTQFEVALENVNEQMVCTSRLNMRNVATAVDKLKTIDRRRYQQTENTIVAKLAACIADIGRAFPERATEAQKYAQRIFPDNSVIAAITIQSRDPCDRSLAGLGGRGKRGVCRDKLAGAGSGPEMVVVPSGSGMKAFAIGKYEVTIGELNVFCKDSGKCQPVTGRNQDLPVTNVSLDTVEAYMRWLSKKADQRYRLPSANEWFYAAKARTGKMDANRNCKVNTRGIAKGDQLLSASAGGQNEWGLVNHVGNAREFAFDQGRRVVVMGGSYKLSLEQCTISTKESHNGSADNVTGFRLLRELKE